MFVADVADDLLDEVLDGDHAGGAAVFVDHQRGLDAVGPDLGHDRITVEGRRHRRDGPGQLRQPGAGPQLDGYREDLFDVHDADGLVEVAGDDREAREPGADGRLDEVGDGVGDLQRLDHGPRRHQLLGGAAAELQGAVDQFGRLRVQ